MSFFAETECRFLQGSTQVLYSLIRHITCRFKACQALIYQLVSGLTGENGKYNYSKAVHLYPPFFDIFCSPKNYKIASALTGFFRNITSRIHKFRNILSDSFADSTCHPSYLPPYKSGHVLFVPRYPHDQAHHLADQKNHLDRASRKR